MSRDANGNSYLPAGNPVISGTVIQTSWANPTMADIGAALTDSLSRSGKGGMATALAMGGFRITALAAALAATDAAQATQVRDSAFAWLNPVSSDATGNAYSGTAVLGTSPVNGTLYIFVADKANTGAITLSVNGSAALPVLINGSPCPPGLLTTGSMVQVVYYNLSYRIANTAQVSGTINSVQSNNAAAISVTNDYGTAIATLNIHANVANGLAQLDGSTKVPIAQLPFTNLAYIGNWNATPGINPAAALNGQFYIIVGAGNLTIYRFNTGTNTYTPQVTACVVGDALIYNTAGTVSQPVGWYYDPAAAAAAVASTVTMVATPTLPGVTVLQTWLNQMDPIIAAKLPLAGGTMTGPILQPTAPGSGNALTNKTYVDTQIAGVAPGVTSFNTRTGAVALTSGDITTALGAAPALLTGAAFTGAVSATNLTASGVATADAFVQTGFAATLGATPVIDFANGQSQELTLSANAVISAINNVPIGTILRLTLLVTTFTVTWPAAVKWPLGVAPNLAGGPLDQAIVTLEKTSNGNLLAAASVY